MQHTGVLVISTTHFDEVDHVPARDGPDVLKTMFLCKTAVYVIA